MILDVGQLDIMGGCACSCCTDALERWRTQRPANEGCTCHLYLPSEQCDCHFCLSVRDA